MHLMQWFTPVPWSTVACEIDLRPGGLFSTVMRSPEGEDFSNTGCYLEVLPERTLTWTNVLGPNFRPSSAKGSSFDLPFTARLQLEPHGAGTRYIATVLHGSEEICAKHDAMGFHVGWGAALDQLVAHMKGP
jgi:uncharacterized protein YndB with AHSA1/START domain